MFIPGMFAGARGVGVRWYWHGVGERPGFEVCRKDKMLLLLLLL